MPTLKILQGLPASGKSTLAKKLEDAGWKVIEKDKLRESIKGESAVLRARDDLVKIYLMKGYNVVSSDTNLNPKHIPRLTEIATSCGAEVEVEFVDTPLDECLLRDAERENPIGPMVIRSMYNRYIKE